MSQQQILFLDKVFLKPKRSSLLRGVELFNLSLLRELAQLDLRVTLVAHVSWRRAVLEHLADTAVACRWIPGLGIHFLHGLFAGLLLRRCRFHVGLIGNVGNGLIPSIRLMNRLGLCAKWVLIGHREASAPFVALIRSLQSTVVALNKVIAVPFEEAGCKHVFVDYGIFNAEDFYPRQDQGPEKSRLDFCLLGALDNPWKGADLAVQAFRALPTESKQKARLHLASFTNPPRYPEENIVSYAWMDAGEIPRFLRSMDVLLVPSRDENIMRETFSQAIVQGMLTGLAILASNLPILSEKLDEGGGLIFQGEQDLVAHMAILIQDAALRKQLGAKARSVALDRYIWDTQSFVSNYLMNQI